MQKRNIHYFVFEKMDCINAHALSAYNITIENGGSQKRGQY
jgi:hypothetical protein